VPEGDTVHKLAAALRAGLAGVPVARVEVAGDALAALAGQEVDDVFSRGKHLFIAFDQGILIRSHLGMHGRWHRYGAGEPWQRPARQASLALWTGDRVFVCFNAREVECLPRAGLRHRDLADRLGPDLTDPGVDVTGLAERARARLPPGAPLADVLLDQGVAAGVGNVYKSEVLFLEGQHPLRRLGETSEETLRRLFSRAVELLRRNLGGGPRVTRGDGGPGSDLWVYGRGGRPCLRCGALIRSARLGCTLRPSFWCPRCQPEPP
jgi:endonuclease-8